MFEIEHLKFKRGVSGFTADVMGFRYFIAHDTYDLLIKHYSSLIKDWVNIDFKEYQAYRESEEAANSHWRGILKEFLREV